MKRYPYNRPELQPVACGLEILIAESNDATGSDMPIDDTDLTFSF